MARRLSILAVLLVAGAACSNEGPPFLAPAPPAPTTTVAGSPSSSAPVAGPPGRVTLSITDLRLYNSEESDNAFRALVDSTAPEISVKLTGAPTPNQVILVCPVNELGSRNAPASACVTPASGATAQVPHGTSYKGLEVVQVGVSGAGPAGNSTAISEIAVTYPAASRRVQFRLPPLVQGEAGSRPVFKMTPVGSGVYSATASFASTLGRPDEAELVLVGASPNENSARGPAPSLSGNLSPPVEAGFRLRNSGSTTLTAVTLDAQFP